MISILKKIRPVEEFATKTGKKIELWLPRMNRVEVLLSFVNRLVDEDTFLTFMVGEPRSLEQEKAWLQTKIRNIDAGQDYLIWAICDGKIIGSSDISRSGSPRDRHVGTVSLMVDQDFRHDGIGQFLLKHVIKKAKEMKLKMLKLTVFSDNHVAIKLYDKLGFVEYGRLPNGLYRQGKFSDAIKMYLKLNNI